MPVILRLYSRTGCHLCDEMLKELETLQQTKAGTFTVEILDIDLDQDMQRRYSLRIPLLTAGTGGKVLCENRFQRQSVLDYLAETTRQV
jgi:thioredoxin-like negative regulator of GroEL